MGGCERSMSLGAQVCVAMGLMSWLALVPLMAQERDADAPPVTLAEYLMTGGEARPATYPVMVTREQLAERIGLRVLRYAHMHRVLPRMDDAEQERWRRTQKHRGLSNDVYDAERLRIPRDTQESVERLSAGVRWWRIESATVAERWERWMRHTTVPGTPFPATVFPVDLPAEGRRVVLDAIVASVLNALARAQQPLPAVIRPGDPEWPELLAVARRAMGRAADDLWGQSSTRSAAVSAAIERKISGLVYLLTERHEELSAAAFPLRGAVAEPGRRRALEERVARAISRPLLGWRSTTAPRPAVPEPSVVAGIERLSLWPLLAETQDQRTAQWVADDLIPGTARLRALADGWISTWRTHEPATAPIRTMSNPGRRSADRVLFRQHRPTHAVPEPGWSDADELRALLPPMAAAPTTATAALAGSLAQRQRHPWLPWVASAGSEEGAGPFPDPALRPGHAVVAAREFGAIPDDQHEDGAAITAALREVGERGGGVVRLEAGRYVLDQPVRLSHDDVALVGEGAQRTRLLLRKSLSEWDESTGQDGPGTHVYSWSGGMIWCEPMTRTDGFDRLPVRGVWAATAARQGAASITVTGPDADRVGELAPGDLVRMEWNASATMCRLIGADPAFDDYPWWQWSRSVPMSRYVRVRNVVGRTLHLAQPLRLPILTCSPVQVHLHPLTLQRIAVRSLAIVAATRAEAAHLREPGFNGIAAEGVVGAEFTDIATENLDNAFVIARSQHVTIRGATSSGQVKAHHFVSIRDHSHDNLIESFQVGQRVWHGLSVQDMSSGNVFRMGRMHSGTFDSHRNLPFDTVRADIVITNTGVPGGDGMAGPFAGRRMVHWNIRIVGGRDPQRVERWSEWVNVPELHPYGALVGVRGAPIHQMPPPRRPWDGANLPLMPRGIASALLLEVGGAPVEPDLYAAQRWAVAEVSRP